MVESKPPGSLGDKAGSQPQKRYTISLCKLLNLEFSTAPCMHQPLPEGHPGPVQNCWMTELESSEVKKPNKAEKKRIKQKTQKINETKTMTIKNKQTKVKVSTLKITDMPTTEGKD